MKIVNNSLQKTERWRRMCLTTLEGLKIVRIGKERRERVSVLRSDGDKRIFFTSIYIAVN